MEPGWPPSRDVLSPEGMATYKAPSCEGYDSMGVKNIGSGAKSLGKLLGFFEPQFSYLLEG